MGSDAPQSSISIIEKDAYLQTIIPKRIVLFEVIKAEKLALQKSISGDPIKVTLPDHGSVKEGKKWETTPLDIAKEVSNSIALICEVNGELWDMSRPLEGDCQLKFFTFDDKEGKDTFWHSSAHILGQALEMTYGCKLCIGPCTTRGEEGFYYDGFYGDLGLNDDHFNEIVSAAQRAVAEKQPFERIEVSREEALEIFSDNEFKIEIIRKLPKDKTITVYRCGPLVDLCSGPHIPNTAFVKAIACLKASAAYWRGDNTRDSLQRVESIGLQPAGMRLLQLVIYKVVAACRADITSVDGIYRVAVCSDEITTVGLRKKIPHPMDPTPPSMNSFKLSYSSPPPPPPNSIN